MQATGKLEWRARTRTWVGRVRASDGQRSAWVDLGTDDRATASAVLEQWVTTGTAPGERR